MKRLEKILKRELDGCEEAVTAMMDYYASSFNSFIAEEDKRISKAEADKQKRLTGITNEDPDEIITDLYQCDAEKADALITIGRLNDLKSYLFEEIEERTKVKGLKK